jgi:hypothetical protein
MDEEEEEEGIKEEPGVGTDEEDEEDMRWLSPSPPSAWTSVSVSASGQYQTAGRAFTTSTPIYTSKDYGVTWTQNPTNFPSNIQDISISSTGQYQIVATSNTGIWISTNYGATWTQNASTSSIPMIGVQISSSGQYITAVTNNGKIYTSVSPLTYLTIGRNPNPSANYVLSIDGNAYASGTYTSGSDYRLKEDIRSLDNTYIVDNIRPVIYYHKEMKKQDIGVIAHELQEHYPYLVYGEKDAEHYQGVNYNGLIGILIKEVQELKDRVKNLEENK